MAGWLVANVGGLTASVTPSSVTVRPPSMSSARRAATLDRCRRARVRDECSTALLQSSTSASEKVARRPPLVSRDHGVEVSKRSDQLAAQVGNRVQPALEGERLRCLWVAGERTINVELAIGQQAIDGPPDLAVS